MLKISNCDVIIDATASTQVFNLLASIATTKQKPMIWTEVYAGGIGGLIARSRPVLDPKPHIMRQAYLEFASNVPPFEFSESAPYAHENDEGQVFVASDADVSVIASHMTRFIVDTIVAPDKSIFPYSMYVIGLSKGWVFSQPFDTKPIQTEHLLSDDGSTIVVDEATKADHISFLINLLEKSDD
jgi:sulfur-carrier protein adenylyltransferase/sulfurtransferase